MGDVQRGDDVWVLFELVLLRGHEALEMLGHQRPKLGVLWVPGSGALEPQVLYERRLGLKAPLGICTQPLIREFCCCETRGEGFHFSVSGGDGCRLRGESCCGLGPTERVSSRIRAVFGSGIAVARYRVPAACACSGGALGRRLAGILF